MAGINSTLLKTTNGGDNWFPQSSGVSFQLMVIKFISLNTGWVVGSAGTIIKTTNGGDNWFQQSAVIQNDFMSVEFVNSQTGWIAGTDGIIIKTTNGGNNWLSQQSTTTNQLNSVKYISAETGWAAGIGGIILKTTNGGSNWSSQIISSAYLLRSISFVDNNTGWIAGRPGIILKTTTGGEPIGIKPVSTEVPDNFFLSQNYPNPFNPETHIKFDISPSKGASGIAKLIIYDVLGREVAVLVNEQLSPGTYEAGWDASNYPSGVYFYKLTTDEYAETRKMVLIK